MEVLIIGGSRFSGKNLVELLVKREHSVTVLNRGKSEQAITSFYKTEKYSYPESVEVIQADRTNNEQLSKALKSKNFSAIIDTCASNEKNIQGILDFAPKELTNYVMVSTASVYDEEKLAYFPVTEDTPMGSEAEEGPIPYSRDKRRAESLLRKSYQEDNFPVTIIRPTYIYGPFNPMYREFYFYDRIMDQKPIYMPGHGETLTDFVYCKDVAWLLAESIENKKAVGQTYNASEGVATTHNGYVKILSEIIGKEAEIIHYNPEILKNEEFKPENWNQMYPFMFDAHLVLSRENARIDLGYQPTPFEKGQTETVEWYKKVRNPDWKVDYSLDKKIAKKISGK
ncbi:MAG: NAD-dependent epimerase/dehydratase family protein [Candidatus Heimdallarchaeota archaeon]|nr:NAD-dependent epimerase/dehydratase family protein [Candidatus Heimdallarchaeota archaeon]MBY8994610.1 NAD-dependent epimerase/dehydratase family protein [Candidatus Heimdallarchaeota archaeon]